MMKRIIGFLTVMLAAACAAGAENAIEGNVVAVEYSQRFLALNDGSVIYVPEEIRELATLTLGDDVIVYYEVEQGQKVATAIMEQVQP